MKTVMRTMIVVFSLCLTATGQSATWRVERDGSGDFTIIQPAFDAAAAGDTILIGPGEYPEYGMHQPPGWGTPIAIGGYKYFDEASNEPLTILGVSADETIIGPTEAIDDFDSGFLIAGENVPLVIGYLSMRTWRQGVTAGYRQAVFSGYKGACLFSISLSHAYDVTICNSEFEDGAGISIHHSQDVLITNCEFVNAYLAVNDDLNVVVRNCTFGEYEDLSYGINFGGGSIAVVENCQITGAEIALNLTSNSSVGMFESYIDGSFVSLYLNGPNSHVYGTNNVIAGAEFSSMRIRQNSTVDFHGNHILHNGTPDTYSVYCDGFYNPPVQDVDLTGNYWGTDDADQIAEWIYDYNDDPSNYALVLYEPFEGGPVPTEQKTWSEVKSMYR